MLETLEFNLEEYEELESTSKVLLEKRGLSDFHGKVIWAKNQTKGRGRFDRQWQTHPENLAVSIGLRFSVEKAQTVPLLTIWSSIAIFDTISNYLKSNQLLTIKWPNDITYKGDKLVGVLCQAKQQGDSVAVALGIGVNIAWSPPELPAIHLAKLPLIQAESVPSPKEFLLKLLANLQGIKGLTLKQMHEQWCARSRFLGRKIWYGNIDQMDSMREAIALRLDQEGNLIVLENEAEKVITNQDLRLSYPESFLAPHE